MELNESINKKTRNVYHSQHRRILNDEICYNRLRYMNSEEFFDLGEGYFKDKVCLDAGCGNTIMLSQQFHTFGAKKVYAFDLGEDWIPDAEAELEKFGVPSGAIELSSGNVKNIHFPDGMFDIVACNGVLTHLEDKNAVSQSFAELSRVNRGGGGMLYVSLGVGKNSGLFEGAIFPALREYYASNSAFKDLIDNIKPQDFAEIYGKIAGLMLSHTGETAPIFPAELFDEDWCVFIQNTIQVPTRLNILYSQQDMEDLFIQNGYKNVKRLNRYVKRKNIRKFLSPLHYDKTSEISQLLFGEGYLEFIAEKI